MYSASVTKASSRCKYTSSVSNPAVTPNAPGAQPERESNNPPATAARAGKTVGKEGNWCIMVESFVLEASCKVGNSVLSRGEIARNP